MAGSRSVSRCLTVSGSLDLDPSNHFTVQRLGEVAPHTPMAVRLLADRSQSLNGDEQAILDLALGATYATTWTDPDGTRRGGFTTDPATNRLERTPLAHLLKVLSDPDQHLAPWSSSPQLVRSLATRLARYESRFP